jgi:diacylglycerol kinase family enzyme
MPDAPLYIVLNAGSGDSDTDTVSDTIAEILNSAGRTHEILRVDDPKRLHQIATQAVAKTKQNDGIVVAAGGDGTLNTVAQVALRSNCPFGVIPQGTFNYFGRTHGISSDTAEATRALLSARVQPVQVGIVNGNVFLVNASLGLYPQLLEDREDQKQRHGRSRLVAAWAGLVTIFRDYQPMLIKLQHEGRTHELRTLTLFVGNNRLQLEQIGLAESEIVEDGKLAAIVLSPVPTLKLLELAARGAMGGLGREPGVRHFAFSSITVAPSSRYVRRVKIATDGEIQWMRTPIEFSVAPEPLLLLKPIDAVPETAH